MSVQWDVMDVTSVSETGANITNSDPAVELYTSIQYISSATYNTVTLQLIHFDQVYMAK